jgi:endoglucanase
MYHLQMNKLLLIVAVLCVSISGISGYTVSGNTLYDPSGAKVTIKGMCRPSFEWNANGEQASLSDYTLMRNKWGANVVRISLNQDFWLAGSSYAATIDQQITWVNQLNMGVILDLHWNNGAQQNMADKKSITFWSSVATRYKGNAWVMFELYNEPHDISWDQWLKGDSTYAGMQQMYDAVRATGAQNTVIVGGTNWAFDLSALTGNDGKDSAYIVVGTNIAYATHPYDYSGKQIADWPVAFGNLASRHPVIMTEFGQYCATNTYVSDLLAYTESKGIHWTAWAWYVQGCAFPSIISDWNGTPYPGVGETVKSYMSKTSTSTTAPVTAATTAPTATKAPTTAPGTAATTAPTSAPSTVPAAAGSLTAYSDGLSSAFEDWSYSGNYNAADTQYVRTGTKSIRTEMAKWWGVYYHAKTSFTVSAYNQLVFYVNGGDSTKPANVAYVALYSTSGSPIGNPINFPVAPTANKWSQIAIPIASFGLEAATKISGFAIQTTIEPTQNSAGNIWIDDISFVPAGAATQAPTIKPTSAPATAAPTAAPTPKATTAPTSAPATAAPTAAPKATTAPTSAPKATTAPTAAPTTKPISTVAPTKAPTATTAPTTAPGSCGISSVSLAQSTTGSWESSGKTVTQYELSVSHNCSGKKLVGMTLTATNWNPVNSWNIVASGSSLSLPNYAAVTTSTPFVIGYQNTGGQASFTITAVTFQ